ncbi:hypothetical protein QWY85_16235 [Neolewinella lacunae]|uniref:Uncharacterized protein n=1 Tax=Neolewinella lacunae TaxID=1517758 RepID=A0A923T7F5_9BACT|nr:hypothetical protein [Neolewinella lacunae]MBC6993506.1 hypothetical protein [Neolewinella lacunae]MDN3636218.1 hypothetical protein [Neolewinella lacunae]
MNDKVYIKIDAPKGKPSPPPERLKRTMENAVVKILTTIIPKANPDFEHLLDKVDHWKIEFDKTENAAWREIGFDKDGVSIVAMPLGDNYGFWTDNQLTMDDYENFDPKLITKEEFDSDWTDFEKKNQKIKLANKG